MFNANINEKLLEKIELYTSKTQMFWTKIKNWIDNPAPNTSSNMQERKDNAREAN